MLEVRVRATPGAAKELVQEVAPNQFEIYVREPAQKNMANRRICSIIAERFRVPITSVRITTGYRSRNKLIRVNT